MYLHQSTHHLSQWPESGPYSNAGIKLPGIIARPVLSPPPTPRMPPTLPTSRTEIAPPDVLDRQLPHPYIRFSEPQYGGQRMPCQRTDPEDATKHRIGQRLPPISHILAEVPPSNSHYQGCGPSSNRSSISSYSGGGLPTPSLSPNTPSIHFRFPGFEPCTLPTPPQSRQPSLAHLYQPEHHDDDLTYLHRSCRTPVRHSYRSSQSKKRNHGQEPYERSKRICQKQPAEDSSRELHFRARDISQGSTNETSPDRSFCPFVEVTTAKPPSRKLKRGRTSDDESKRCNEKYDFIESLFIIYHTVDRGLSWAETEEHFKKWFPDNPLRTTGGVQCQYYRLNARIPALDSKGLLDFGPFTKEELRNEKVVSKDPYPLEGGVRYRIHEVKCRDRTVPLSERFPEEVVSGDHPWILREHQHDEKTRLAAERRSRQRTEYLRGYLT